MQEGSGHNLPVLASFSHYNLTITITLSNNLLCSIIEPHFQYDYDQNQPNQQYDLGKLKMLQDYDLDTVFKRINEQIEATIKPKYEFQRNVVVVLTKKVDDLVKSMINGGMKIYTSIFTMKNINTKVDVLFVSRPNNLDRNFVVEFIGELLHGNVPAVLHGSEIIFHPPLEKKEKPIQIESNESYTIITGASRGIGRGIAQSLAKQGRNLILTGRPGNKQITQFAISLAQTHNIKAQSFYLDVRDEQNITEFAQKLKQRKLPIECVVFNAGVGTKTSLEQANQTTSQSQILLQVNSMGPIRLFNSLKSAQIINKSTLLFFLSTVGCLRGFAQFHPVDIVSKYAADVWAQKLLKQSYQVMSICPGATDTEMFQKSTLNYASQKNKLEEFVANLPKGIVIKPEDIAHIVAIFSRRRYRDYLVGAKIAACCGMHLDYKPLPSV